MYQTAILALHSNQSALLMPATEARLLPLTLTHTHAPSLASPPTYLPSVRAVQATAATTCRARGEQFLLLLLLLGGNVRILYVSSFLTRIPSSPQRHAAHAHTRARYTCLVLPIHAWYSRYLRGPMLYTCALFAKMAPAHVATRYCYYCIQ